MVEGTISTGELRMVQLWRFGLGIFLGAIPSPGGSPVSFKKAHESTVSGLELLLFLYTASCAVMVPYIQTGARNQY